MSIIEKVEASPRPKWWKLTEHDLPNGNGERLPSQVHFLQISLSIQSLYFAWKDRQDFFVAGHMFVYFHPDQMMTDGFMGPDVFVAMDVERRVRESWVTWQEGKPPDLVIELPARTTTAVDRKLELLIYQDKLKVPEYFWFNHRNGHIAGYELIEGVYRRIELDRKGRLRSRKLDLLLVRWKGSYGGVEGRWLRWANLDGTLLPTPEEVIETQWERAKTQQCAQVERQRTQEAE